MLDMIGRGTAVDTSPWYAGGVFGESDPTLSARGLHSRETFQAIIRRERARVDRNSHCFSLAVFEIPRNGVRRKAYKSKLADTLVERARFTDETGWLSEADIGVLLTETSGDGTRIFADHVKRCMAKWGPIPTCRVYTYPSDWEDGHGHGDDHPQLPFDDPLPRGKSNAPEPPAQEKAGCPTAPVSAEEDPFDAFATRFLAVRLPFWKRALDVVGAFVGLVVMSPLMLAAAALIKLVSPGPVFFRQDRVGYLGKTFRCLKFRTMHLDNDVAQHRRHLSGLINSDDPMTKLDGGRDRRIIPFGKVLRLTAIDELPQLFNVLCGEMSLVGPRPCIPYEYREYHRWHRNRVDSVPGLTGLWQVNGKNRTTFKQMMRLDIRYAREMSLWLDLTILVRTVPAILTQIRDARKLKRARKTNALFRTSASEPWASGNSSPALS